MRAGVPVGCVADLEAGRDWVDRRGSMARLAAALRLDVTELAGQPYAPHGRDQAEVQAVAFRFRRRLVGAPRGPLMSRDVLATRIEAAELDENSGDEAQLARSLPALLEAVDAARASESAPGADEELVAFHDRVHVLSAGLLRRLGYRDLAWVLLHRARVGVDGSFGVTAEEARLFLDMGLPDHAVACAERAAGGRGVWELPVLAAVALAVAGRRAEAERVLDVAERRATGAAGSAVVAAARAEVAFEDGDLGEAADRVRRVDGGVLGGARRAEVLVLGARIEARSGEVGRAVDRLVEAESAAPLRFRLDPFARELVAGLAGRLRGGRREDELRALAERLDLR